MEGFVSWKLRQGVGDLPYIYKTELNHCLGIVVPDLPSCHWPSMIKRYIIDRVNRHDSVLIVAMIYQFQFPRTGNSPISNYLQATPFPNLHRKA